jgi:hypothetical protein
MFQKLKRWIESMMIPRYTHFIGLKPHLYTPSEAQIFKDNIVAFKKTIENKLMAANATSFWNDEKWFYIAKGKVEALEDLLRYCDIVSKAEVLTSDIIPLVVERTKKKDKVSGAHF